MTKSFLNENFDKNYITSRINKKQNQSNKIKQQQYKRNYLNNISNQKHI